MTKFITTLFLTILMSFNIVAASTPWKEIASTNEVSIQVATQDEQTDNGIHRYVIIRVVNKTSEDISVTFNKDLWYNGNLLTDTDIDESTVTVTVSANGYVEGNVNQTNETHPWGRGLLIFSKDVSGTIKSELTNYQITNIVVN